MNSVKEYLESDILGLVILGENKYKLEKNCLLNLLDQLLKEWS